FRRVLFRSCELLRLEVVRVRDGRPDRLRGPLRIADRLVDVRLRDVRIHRARSRCGVRVEVRGASTVRLSARVASRQSKTSKQEAREGRLELHLVSLGS